MFFIYNDQSRSLKELEFLITLLLEIIRVGSSKDPDKCFSFCFCFYACVPTYRTRQTKSLQGAGLNFTLYWFFKSQSTVCIVFNLENELKSYKFLVISRWLSSFIQFRQSQLELKICVSYVMRFFNLCTFSKRSFYGMQCIFCIYLDHHMKYIA